MKNFTLYSSLLALLLLFGFNDHEAAQCAANNTKYPSGTINAGTGALVTIANNNYEGEYAQVTGIVNNSKYSTIKSIL